MAEQKDNHTEQQGDNKAEMPPDLQQQGYNYLSNALKVSFTLLKIIMIVLIVVFLASGFRTIGPDERALVLRFGKIRGVGENRLLKPGYKLLFPYPIHEVVKIPVEKKIDLAVNTFWYYQKPGEEMTEDVTKPVYVPPDLDPLKDGYCLLRGQKQKAVAAVSGASDYNIAHSKWVLTYQITNPERFYRNVLVNEKLQAGQNYADMIEQSVVPLLRDIVADAVVTAMVNYTIEEALSGKVSAIIEHVRKLAQNKLDETQSGIKIVSLQRTSFTWPRQVDKAFQAAHKATNTKEKTITEAKLYAEKTLNETAGPVAEDLVRSLEDANTPRDRLAGLWSQLAGEAQEKIAQAMAYRTQVVENAKANAQYLTRVLPQYRKRPKLVLQKIYQDAIERVLNEVDEKMIIQPTQGPHGAEIRIQLNRDPTLKKKAESTK